MATEPEAPPILYSVIMELGARNERMRQLGLPTLAEWQVEIIHEWVRTGRIPDVKRI